MEEKEVLILSTNPYFSDKDSQWLKKYGQKIKSARGFNSWWQKNTLVLEQDQIIRPGMLLRTLADFGYEKVQFVSEQGEFSWQGGILKIFPPAGEEIISIEFAGNQIESIRKQKPELPELRQRRRKTRFNTEIKNKQDIKQGDYLVHIDHGIGIFKGYQNLRGRLYLSIEYAKGDLLLLPWQMRRKISIYIGFARPAIHRLGSPIWRLTKKKVRKSALRLAKKLLALYTERKLIKRPPYAKDEEIQKEFESNFEFEETADQQKAILDVKADMEKENLMDRIICGDVGFGKTEIALRAALKAIISGKQVAFLTPTTILAEQHFFNFKRRFSKMPVQIQLLSRTVPPKRQKSILRKLAAGKIDLLVGTSRLLSRDVKFKNLSLLIIDEEQRFGVRQKEKLKEARKQLDVLSLTATPIPRTLFLTLSGIWDISLITTAPWGKKSIKTFVSAYNWKKVSQALQREINRGGQIYYLHNRIESLQQIEKRIKKSFPGLETAIIHGRKKGPELLNILTRFREGKIRLLLATTIIENGLDFPNVNTLIVENAEKLGLSQAHQIRGRIGRRQNQAYAYFFFNKKELRQKEKERLKNLLKYQGIGAGYQIALKDLQIRGAGNILGKEQSGNINAVGLNLYSQMLSEAVEKLRHELHEMHETRPLTEDGSRAR